MKTLITNMRQAHKTKHEDGVYFLCSRCHEEKPVQTNGGTGYAYDSNRRMLCYDCANKDQVEALKDRTKPFLAYVSGNSIVTWPGGHLMRITRAWPCKLTRPSFTHSAKGYLSIHAVDVHGGHWHGRGSDGIAIKMRPCKSK